jgi:hypothetical protein
MLIRRSSYVVPMLLLAMPLGPRAASRSPEPGQRAGMMVWDTGRSSKDALSPEEFSAKSGWTQIPEDKTGGSLKGDLVLSNGRVSIVARKQGSGIDLHSAQAGGAQRSRLTLQSAGGELASGLSRVALVENSKGAAALEVWAAGPQGVTLSAKFRIKRGDQAVEVSPGRETAGLRIACPGRLAILPDFFSDDIRIDAGRIPLPTIEVPSENFILHPTGNGDSIVMGVFENRDQDIRLTLEGEGEKRIITGSEIRFGEGHKIWVGLLEAPQIWHSVARLGPVLKPTPLDWKLPFGAQWRVDLSYPHDVTDSNTMLLQDGKDGQYVQPSFTGDVHSGGAPKRISPDRVQKGYYTCWADPRSQVFLMPLNQHVQLPVTIYPLNRSTDTPSEVFTVVDLARSCLGTGPCDYLLDLEGHKDQYKGRATCGVRDILGRIYSSKTQKARHDDVEKCLNDGLTFVTHIRSRITDYLEFLGKTRQYLEEQNRAHPELKAPLAELGQILSRMDAHLAERQGKIKTPADVAAMNEEFRKNVLDYEGPDAMDRCRKYTLALVDIGGNQDELVSECRGVVKSLRQRAGILTALDPRMAATAGVIRARTQEVLRNPAWHEGAQK